MIIALDFDGTHTADPALWNRFIADSHAAGHRVVIATMRYERENWAVNATVTGIPAHDIFYTARKAKRPHLAALGVRPDVWIDDNPHWIDGDVI